MPTQIPAGFTLAIQTFNPISNGSSCCPFTISATTTEPLNQSWVVLSGTPTTPGGLTFQGSGSNIQVTPPTGDALQMTFTLADSAYALVGLYFTAQIVGGPDPSIMGMTDFPSISCNATFNGGAYSGSTLQVLDVSGLTQTYVYKIVVQRLSDGALGLIDPTIEPDA